MDKKHFTDADVEKVIEETKNILKISSNQLALQGRTFKGRVLKGGEGRGLATPRDRAGRSIR